MKVSDERLVVKVNTSTGATLQQSFSGLRQALWYVTKELQKFYANKTLDIYIYRQNQIEQHTQPEHNPYLSSQTYQPELLRQQILLFDSDKDIKNFIQTQKMLAENIIKQLTDLTFSLMKLAKDFLGKPKAPLTAPMKASTYTLQQLDGIQQQCMKTLHRVKQERKRAENCCICLLAKSKVVVAPCMHMVLCTRCGTTVTRCPICSQPITQIAQVYR